MILRQAERKQARIRLGLLGPAGSGKTYSALLMAAGLTQNWATVAVIDTEHHAADLYAHLGPYQVLSLESPFSPERYMEALRVCEESGIEAVILDSITHEWEFILDAHGATTGNTYTNWAKFTPRHNAFINAMLQSPCHILATIRAKQDYVLAEKNGRMTPEKVGLKGITREGMDYEFTLLLELDIRHQARATKDRTGLFADKPEFVPSVETGQCIREWCQQGTPLEQVIRLIQSAPDIPTLIQIYNTYPEFRYVLAMDFSQRKNQLQQANKQLNTNNYGNATHAAR